MKHLKQWLGILLAVCLLAGVGAPALADQPRPVEIIPWEELPPVIDGQHHYLLLCVDQWQGKPWNLGNTDGMVLVTLDTRAHRVMLTSFIRDALVQRPDGKIGRINYIAKNYSPEDLCKTIAQHIGVRVEKYILFDFSQIANIVEYLGGVDIEMVSDEINYLRRYAVPPGSVRSVETGADLRSGSRHPAGLYHFSGHSAVIYMRIRKVAGHGDFTRTQRVRTVLSTLADKCREISYEDARALVDNVLANSTMTNMSLDEMVTAMDQAYGLRGCTIEELLIPPDKDFDDDGEWVRKSINYAAMDVQELNWKKCREVFDDYLQNSFLVMDDEEE